MKQKIINLQQKLSQGLVGREDTIKTALLAMLAGENVLLIGPPGTGKSMVSRRISQSLAPQQDTSPYFEYLLTKFSTPEELFGPLSISALKQDKFERKTAGYLPDVQVAFLDEIFKASSSILNSLLTILNERKFHNGIESQEIPLQALIAASNELPKGQTELAALYDRFLLRCFVGYLDQNNLEQLFNLPEAAPLQDNEKLTTAELTALHHQVCSVSFPKEVQQALCSLWQQHAETFKEDADEQLSDRRFVKILNLLRVSAATNGRNEANLSDAMLLKDCLWNNDENREKVMDLLTKVLRQHDRLVDLDQLEEANDQPEKSAAPSNTSREIKGYQGSGTEHDPILIENILHLKGLERPEIGQQGYYFRQTADIDCSSLTTWLNIQEFKGIYNGGGFRIIYKNVYDTQSGGAFNIIATAFKKPKYLIHHLIQHAIDSTFYNIRLNGYSLSLVEQADNCTFSHISSSAYIVEQATDCFINSCRSRQSIAHSIDHTKMQFCQTEDFLVSKTVTNQSEITNCYINVSFEQAPGQYGLITKNLENSTIEYCFIKGNLQHKESGHAYYAGISWKTDATSTIRRNAVGDILFHGNHYVSENQDFYGLIIYEGEPTLDHNISIDRNNHVIGTIANDSNRKNAESISAEFFTQYYFEHTLGWDFEHTWIWNDETNEPNLRETAGSGRPAMQRTGSNGKQASLLEQQLVQNIWL